MNKEDFFHMMRNLPEKVSDEEIEEMFSFADVDNDGKISYDEFQIMINPPKPSEKPKPCKNKSLHSNLTTENVKLHNKANDK